MDLGNRTGSEHLPGAALSRDIAAGEHVEKELDVFISRRHERRVQDEGERAEEEAWRESARAYEEQRRLQARAEWHLYHTAQAGRMRRTLEELISYHETQAERYLPKGAA